MLAKVDRRPRLKINRGAGPRHRGNRRLETLGDARIDLAERRLRPCRDAVFAEPAMPRRR
jgi:hypothetical protein